MDNNTYGTEKFNKLFEQFPWVREIISHNSQIIPSVEIVDITLWERKRFHIVEKEGFWGWPVIIYEKLLTIDWQGKIIGTVGIDKTTEPPKIWPRFWLIWQRIVFENLNMHDTLEDLVSRLGKQAENVGFVLSLWKNSLIIYKVPKGRTIQQKIKVDKFRIEAISNKQSRN